MKNLKRSLALALCLVLVLSAVVIVASGEGSNITSQNALAVEGGFTVADGTEYRKEQASNANPGLKLFVAETKGKNAVGQNIYPSLSAGGKYNIWSNFVADDENAYLVYDFDFATMSTYYEMRFQFKVDAGWNLDNADKPTVSAGVEATGTGGGVFNGTVGGVKTSTNLNLAPYDYNHFTVILDMQNNMQYFYVDGEIAHEAKIARSLEKISSVQGIRFDVTPTSTIDSRSASMVIANPVATVYKKGALAEIIQDTSKNLTDFTDCELVYTSDYKLPLPENTFESDGVAYSTIDEATIKGNGTVKLLAGYREVSVAVKAPVVVEANGYQFNYTCAEGIECAEADGVYTFTKKAGYSTVTWYGYSGEVLLSETYAVGSTLTPPTVPSSFNNKTFVGWSTDKDATAGDTTLVAGESDANYYLISSLYTVKKISGETENYYTDTEIYSIIKDYKAGDVYEIWEDVTLTPTASISKSGRVEIVLKGATLTVKATTAHAFSVDKSDDDIIIRGEKLLDSEGNEKPPVVTLNGGYNFLSSANDKVDPKVTLKDLTFNVNGSNSATDLRAGTLTFDNCVVNGKSAGTYPTFKVLTRLDNTETTAYGEPKIVFKNSTVDVTSSVSLVSVITNNGMLDNRGSVEIYNSTVTTKVVAIEVGQSTSGTPKGTPSVYIDGKSVINSDYAPLNVSHPNTTVTIEKGARMKNSPVLNNTNGITSIGGVNGSLTVDVTGNNYSSYIALDYTPTDSDYSFTIYNADGTEKLRGISVDWCGALYSLIPESGKIVLHKNHTASHNPEMKKNFTIDLGGNTLSLNGNRFWTTVGSELNLINGKVIIGSSNLVYGNGTHVFRDLEIAIGRVMADVRAGSLTFENCVITQSSANNGLFTLGYNSGSNVIEINLNSVVFNQPAASENGYIFDCQQGKVTINATDCTFNLGEADSIMNATKAGEATLNLTGCEVNGALNGGMVSQGTRTVNISDTYFSAIPAFGIATVNYANGETLATVAGGGFKITKPTVTPKANLTLYADFNLNLWLPVNQGVTEIKVGDVIYKVADLESAEGMYKVVVGGIAANAAADDVTFYISYAEGEEVYTVTLNYSVVKYAASLLANTTASAESKALVASAVDYIGAAYTYAGTAAPEALTALMASENYTAAKADARHDEVAEVPATETNKGDIAAAISSAQLSLGSNLKLVLNLNASYTGALTLTYAGNTYTYTVEAGKVENATYVELDMRAYDLYDEVVTIVAGEYQGSYDLKAYAASDKVGEDVNLEALVLALYNFCKEADEYKAIVNA